ncbi:Na+/H+ antiporter [Flavobacterium sp.]|uniref:Na+/H+ antiporter n=1 Tax=Flavobacterium sp. TaxID=239 RepID=UPI00121AF506|nr:Na+/H+ antiporter [Flavobacterium sp.]RZJ70681.1 MAG: Na+/H+ antiporter [Flavobacterium sp.]
MAENFPFYLILVLVIALLVMLANKIRVAYPVLLVLAGLGLSFVPGIPQFEISPELIFLIFLPPLLYEAAWSISWKDLWFWRRIICSFAFLVVLFSAFSVALAAHYLIPGFSLALGFLLGGIVSPPDAVSAGAILKFVNVPKRLSSILEGESLLNDASSLIIFRFALIAVGSGEFIFHEAAMSFGWMLFSGVGIGVLTGFVFMKLHKYLPTDANIDVIMTLVAPYAMYILAEEVHGSGVLAVVSGGLFLSNNRFRFLQTTSRIRSVNVWASLSFLLNGLVFMLIGLDLPHITNGLEKEGFDVMTAIGYGVLVTFVLIVARLISCYAAVIITLIMRNFITVADASHPGFRVPIILGWSGMRGVVSLAAALSIPVMISGEAFPQRNLILFITFVVILLTLVGQGLTLPWIIKKFHPKYPENELSEAEIENNLKHELAAFALSQLRTHYPTQMETQPLIKQIAFKLQNNSEIEGDDYTGECITILSDLISRQRHWLLEKNKGDQHLNEDIVRKHLLRLDLEEEKLRLS